MNSILFIELPEGFVINKRDIEKIARKDSGCLIRLRDPGMDVITALGFEDLKECLWGFSPEFHPKETKHRGSLQSKVELPKAQNIRMKLGPIPVNQ